MGLNENWGNGVVTGIVKSKKKNGNDRQGGTDIGKKHTGSIFLLEASSAELTT